LRIIEGYVFYPSTPSSFAASCPAFTSSLKANLVAVERGHGSGSITTMGCGGAMPVDERARRQSEHYARRRGARCSESEVEKTKAMGAKC
jgi:hypothetical protein